MITADNRAAAGDQGRAGTTSILIVDDEQLFARAVATRLRKAGYECRVAATLAEARSAAREREPSLLLLDMRLPDGSGLDFIQQLRENESLPWPVIVLTAYGEIEDAVSAMKLAASDYLKKPIDLDELLLTVEKVLANRRVWTQLQNSRTREAKVADGTDMIGQAPVMDRVRAYLDRISQLSGAFERVPQTVLITGETGTGKDVVARHLHQRSARRAQPFVHVDCASLPKDLIEAELFGHVKGAFTSAHSERTGLIEVAEGGVVFLDEIGELPLDLQGRLLAVLDRRTLRRVGSSQERRVDAWFIAATNRDVEAMLAAGALRADLYYRLNVWTLRLPPLRERGGDVLLLAKHFGEQVTRRYGFGGFGLTPDAEGVLCAYPWPGNVRELRHVIERAVLLKSGGELNAASLMLGGSGISGARSAGPAIADLTLEHAEHLLIEQALAASGHNVSEAARRLGVTRMAMRYRMKKHGLS